MATLDVATHDPSAPRNAHRGLDAVFRPRSIAVIGASRHRGAIGAEIFHNLLEFGFTGPVYPIHPHAVAIQGVRAYPTIRDVPDPVDLAVVVVPAGQVEGVLQDCGRKGVRAAVVISSGFKEVGAEGVARERRLVEIAHRHGMRLIGPNCLGVLNTEPGVRMNATFAPTVPAGGPVAFSSQSGALGLAILDLAAKLGIGFSQFVSVGNKAEVSGNDLLEFWERDPGTRLILLYLESFGNPRRFLELARRIGRDKPIVAVKSGRTSAGSRAASSHTGSMAGPDTAVSALCAQAGVIRAETMEELFDVAMLLANQPVPRGPRVGIVTNAGGPGIMASDACETHGLEVTALAGATCAALRAFLPAAASVRNPVDMIASATPEAFEKAVRLVANDPNVDAVLALYVPPMVTRPLDVARAIVRGAEEARADARSSGRTPKPILSCFMGSHGVHQSLRSLQESHIPSYAFPESAAIALAHAVRYGRWRESPEGVVPVFPVDRAVARRVIDEVRGCGAAGATTWLAPDPTRALLSAYGIATPVTVFAIGPDEAVEAAENLGYPVAVKLVSPTLTHKSEVGGVVLDLRDAAEVRWAVREIARRLEQSGAGAGMSGVIVQPMVTTGAEAVIGMTRDPVFGPLVMFGLGGVHVEVLRDVMFRIHPLTDRDASEMVRGIRGVALLQGYRGAPRADMAALEEAILRVSQLAGDFPEVVEMDLNPLRVHEQGQGCEVLDARVAVKT
jgi:acetyl coenzyme A synthetase (ADP forming)-like protein